MQKIHFRSSFKRNKNNYSIIPGRIPMKIEIATGANRRKFLVKKFSQYLEIEKY